MSAEHPTSTAPDTVMMDYFVPPLVIPVVLLMAVFMFGLFHGPLS